MGRAALAWVEKENPWTNVYGLGRTILATATALTLALNSPGYIFTPGAGVDEAPICTGVRHLSAFCLVPSAHLEWARWACVLALLVVASGWRPRLTGVVHWWIAFSVQASALILDGGDQIASILALLMIPVALTDARRWHWSAGNPAARSPYTRLLACTAMVMVRVQVAGIYLHSAAGKFGAPEWADGTAMYYWLTHPAFGMPWWSRPVMMPLLINPVTVSLLTWSVVVGEFFLAAALVMPKHRRATMLVLGVALHLGIILFHGLVSFGSIMVAALILYLRPWERPWRLPARTTTVSLRARAFRALGVAAACGALIFQAGCSGQHAAVGNLVVDEDIVVTRAGTTVRGKLKHPAATAPVPVVIIVPGSGPVDMDGNSAPILSTNSYLDLSEGLADRGVASVRYDKRGIGQSKEGVDLTATSFQDDVDDAAAFVDVLRTSGRFSRVYLAGHSEGGVVASLVAGKKQLDGIVLMAAPSTPLTDALKRQLKGKISEADWNSLDVIFERLRTSNDYGTVPASLQPIFTAPSKTYIRSFMDVEPSAAFRATACPATILQGTTDVQVTTEDARALLAVRPDAALVLLDGINHVLKEGAVGDQTSYHEPSLPLGTGVLDAVVARVAQ